MTSWRENDRCVDCGCELDAGTAKVFTCCDECWDMAYHPRPSAASVPPEPPALDSGTYGELPDAIRALIPSHEWDNMTRDEQRAWLISTVAALRATVGPCYVMGDGECISPFKCAHGDGLSLDEFAMRVTDQATAALRAELAARRVASGFDLDAFSRENLERCESPTGFNHRLSSWSLSDWMTATLGELGEAANVAKKLNRVRDGIVGNDETEDELRRKLASEIADAFIYLDLMAQSQGIRLSEAVRRTFDAKSDKIGYRARSASGEDASHNPDTGQTP